MLKELIIQYGYIIIILGTFIEGEPIMILFGYLADRGLLNIFLVIFFGFIGTITFDTLTFLLGYIKGEPILKKIPFLKQQKINKAKQFIIRYNTSYIFFYRFIYGARIVSILILGTSRTKISKFLIYNSITGLLWTTTFTLGGFFIGKAFKTIINNIALEVIFIILIIIIFILVFYIIKTKIYHNNTKIIK